MAIETVFDARPGGNMAAWRDVLARLDEGLHTDARLHVESVYRPADLPGWLYNPWATARRNAGPNRHPVLVVNCKGIMPADTVCLVRLADLERLASGRT